MSRVFAYCRVSTLEQTTENQRREIEAAGFAIRSQRLIEYFNIMGNGFIPQLPSFGSTQHSEALRRVDDLYIALLGRGRQT